MPQVVSDTQAERKMSERGKKKEEKMKSKHCSERIDILPLVSDGIEDLVIIAKNSGAFEVERRKIEQLKQYMWY